MTFRTRGSGGYGFSFDDTFEGLDAVVARLGTFACLVTGDIRESVTKARRRVHIATLGKGGWGKVRSAANRAAHH